MTNMGEMEQPISLVGVAHICELSPGNMTGHVIAIPSRQVYGLHGKRTSVAFAIFSFLC